MKFQNQVKGRRLQAVVFHVVRYEVGITFPALRVVLHGSFASCATPRLSNQRGGTFAIRRRT